MKRFLWLLIIALLLTACSSTLPEEPVTGRTESSSLEPTVPDARTSTFSDTESPETIGSASVSAGDTSSGKSDEAVLSEDISTITVQSASELLANMRSNRHFLLTPGGDYDMDKIDKSLKSDYDINTLNNVIIEGIGEKQVDFITGNKYADVLSIATSSDITLKNLKLGHDPENEDPCSGRVLSISSQCRNITIENCTLFGCGSVGIYADSVENLKCRNSVIRDCSRNLTELTNVQKATFENCDFVNSLQEAVKFEDCRDIALTDCRLKGILIGYPQLVSDNENLLQPPSDGREYIIDEQAFPGIHLKNISLTGKAVIGKLEAIHKDVKATFELGQEQLTYETSVTCDLTYISELDESEYVPQINAAKKIISAYFEEPPIIYVDLLWPGNKGNKVYSTYTGSIWLFDDDIEPNKIMNNGKKYMSIGEAAALLRSWLPPFITVDANNKQSTVLLDESIDIELFTTAIVDDSVYYRFDIFENGDKGRIKLDMLDVNAEDGSISAWFDGNDYIPVKHASGDQIAAVVNYLHTADVVLPPEEKIWAYIVDNDYIRIFSETTCLTYYLTNKDGTLTAEPYVEYAGD